MRGPILVVNAGSSSLKFSLFDAAGGALSLREHGKLEAAGEGMRIETRGEADAKVDAQTLGTPFDHDRASAWLLSRYAGDATALGAVGHRVVHGGPDRAAPQRVDDALVDELERLVPLAPLHQPFNLAPIRALRQQAPALPQVACFDTAFHRTQSDVAQAYALPRALTGKGIRRYGFHGLSYEFIAARLAELDATSAAGRVIALHLGNGASLCAMKAGRSEATSMGFTALEGLPMGTRSGALDPGVVLHLQAGLGMTVPQVEHLLYHESGLLGVSGVSSDMRILESSAEPDARFAIELFCYRIGREIGSAVAALGGVDALVFTAGIGENSPRIRARVCEAARWLGVELDVAANDAGAVLASTPGSRVKVYVIPTDEEKMIAQHTREVLAA
jgi:acetate kinase